MTLWDHYARLARETPTAAAVIDQQGTTLSHGELLDLATDSAAGLCGRGLSAGHHLGVFLPNRAIWPVLALASARAGVGVLGLNTRFRERELDHLLNVAEVQTVAVVDSFLGIDGPALMAGLDRPVECLVLDSQCVTVTLPDRPSVPLPDQGDPLIGFTTSGTTGFPKVAMHDQTQTLSHLLAVGRAFGLNADTVTLVPLPFCGAFGYTSAMATLMAGGTVVLHETWDPDAVAAAMSEHGVTFCSASDDMLLAMVDSDRFGAAAEAGGQRPSFSWTSGGFADFTNAGARAVELVEQASGGVTRLSGLYGSSEGFALMSTWDRDQPREMRSRNGGHLVGAEMAVRACHPETGEVLAHHQPGELQFTGPNLIDGYLNNPEATAAAFSEDGWYRSGDLGHTVAPDRHGHQGFVFLARLGDTLRLRGFLCDPAEIEKHLEAHPAVALAQVVGVTRPGVGDVAVAFVKQAAGHTADELALQAHCQQGLANYKRPERIVSVDEFPVTEGPNGIKIRKVELRDQAAVLLGVEAEA